MPFDVRENNVPETWQYTDECFKGTATTNLRSNKYTFALNLRSLTSRSLQRVERVGLYEYSPVNISLVLKHTHKKKHVFMFLGQPAFSTSSLPCKKKKYNYCSKRSQEETGSI